MNSDKFSLLPKGAKRVFKGQIFDVYQWNQLMYDGSKKVFETLARPDSVQVIATVGKQILIQKQEQPDTSKFISLPGGRLEEDEDPLVGIKRELLEETGYHSDDWELWKKFQPGPKILHIVYIFIARNCVVKQEPQLENGEKITNKLISFEELLNLSGNKALRQKELDYDLLKMRLYPKEKEKFFKLLFPSHE